MKILVITNYFPPIIGGISNSVRNFYETFKKKNHKVTVFVLQKSKISFPRGVYNSYNYRKFKPKNTGFILKNIFFFIKQIIRYEHPFTKKIIKLLSLFKNLFYLVNVLNLYKVVRTYDKIYNYDLILTYDSTLIQQIGVLLKKNNNKRYITVAHGNDILNKSNQIFTKIGLNFADKVIVRSRFIKDLIISLYGVGKKRIAICPDGITLKDFELDRDKFVLREELNLSKDNFYILSVGLLNLVRKAPDLVLKSLNELRNKYNTDIDKIEYILIGRDAPKIRKCLYNLSEKYNLNNNFRILVNVSDELRNKYYKASDIFVMPSRDLQSKGKVEGFGNVFIEAGYYYLPSIGSNTGGIPDAIDNGKSGFLINSFKELVEKIKLFYENEDLKLKMGIYAHKRVLNKFIWDKIYLDYLNAFNDIFN